MTQQVLPTVGVTSPWGNVLNGLLSQSITPSGFLTTVSTLTSSSSPYTINSGSFTYSSGLPANTGGTSGGGSTNNGSPIWTGETLLCNPTSGNITINLPNPGGVAGFYPIHTIKRITSASNTITITPTSASIDAGTSGASITLPTTIGSSITLISDGTNWWTYSATGGSGIIPPAFGGTGVANNAASTLTFSGNYATTFTLTGTTSLTLPTSGTVLAFVSTATAGGTTNLTSSSITNQVFTGTSNQTIVLPDVTSAGMSKGLQWTIMNNSTGSLTIEIYGGSSYATIATLAPNALATFICVSTSSNAVTSWSGGRTVKRIYLPGTGGGTVTISTDLYDVVRVTGLTTSISFVTSGTPEDGDTLRVSVTDSGTQRSVSFSSTYFEASTVPLPTQTVASARLDVGFFYNAATSKWRCVAIA